MPTFKEDFSAGETRQYNLAGGFLRLLALGGNSPVNVDLYSDRSGRVESLTDVQAGVSYTGPYDRVLITSKIAQTVQFILASGRVEYDFAALTKVTASSDSGYPGFVVTSLGGAIKFDIEFSGYFTASGTNNPRLQFVRVEGAKALLDANFQPTGAVANTPFGVVSATAYDQPGVGTFHYYATHINANFTATWQATELLR